MPCSSMSRPLSVKPSTLARPITPWSVRLSHSTVSPGPTTDASARKMPCAAPFVTSRVSALAGMLSAASRPLGAEGGVGPGGRVERGEPGHARLPVVLETGDRPTGANPGLLLDGRKTRADLAPHRIVFPRMDDARNRKINHRALILVQHIARHRLGDTRRDKTPAPDL